MCVPAGNVNLYDEGFGKLKRKSPLHTTPHTHTCICSAACCAAENH